MVPYSRDWQWPVYVDSRRTLDRLNCAKSIRRRLRKRVRSTGSGSSERPFKPTGFDDGIADSGRSGVDAPSSGTPATLSMRTVCTSIAQYSADDVRLTSVIQEGPGDREAMAWVATTQGIKSEDVRDLMVASVESRFGQVNRLPRAIEWLSDNGSGYIAKDTKRFARDLGFEPLTTPVVGRGVADRLLPPQAAEMSC
jgi:transposase InsO family protein